MEKLIRLVISHDDNQLDELVSAQLIQQERPVYFKHSSVKNMLLDFREVIQKMSVEEKTLDHYLSKYREKCVKDKVVDFICFNTWL